MSILITGSGLIGAQTAKLFVDKGDKVILYDIAPRPADISEIVDTNKITIVRGDILDLPFLLSIIREQEVDTVVHTAALLPAALLQNLYAGLRINVEGFTNILEASRQMDVRRVVFTSTIGVYSRDGDGNTSETMDENFPVRPGSLYGMTKLMCESIGSNYFNKHGLDFVALRFANVLGPWNGPLFTATGPLFKEMIGKPLKGEEAKIEKPSPIVTNGEWLYSKDAARALLLAGKKEGLTERFFNIGMGRVYHISEMVEIVKDLIPGASISLGTLPIVPARAYNLDRSKRELDYSPEYDLKRALSGYVDWLRARAN
ncbi:MAG: hypothetical protein CMO12_00075 [Thaumarchaeota archaeon]|jgi:nucleoside-diphosphate-sugar epimerase|nr:hypothetical protein [Nitrososphaerota archaeon]